MRIICKKLEELREYHNQMLKLVNSFRNKKTDLINFSKEVPYDTRYILLNLNMLCL